MKRPPADLRQYDDNACVVCITTNLLYMFYLLDYPNFHWVDQQLKRRPGELVKEESFEVFLLSQGLSLFTISENDSQSFLTHGIDYLRYYYRELWTDEWDNVYTPNVIEEARQLIRRSEQQIAARRLPRAIEPRKPTMDDLVQLIEAGYVIDLATRRGNDPYTHAMLAYAREGNTIAVYEPSRNTPTLFNLRLGQIEREWDGFWLNAWRRE